MSRNTKDTTQPHVSTEDASRIARYLEGDPDTYQEVNNWIQVELRRGYPRLAGEWEDLGQTVHGKLLVELRAGRFEGRATLRTYLVGIVHRTALDRLRLLYRDRALSESLSDPDDVHEDNPYRQIVVRDEVRLAHRVVMSLPKSCRELWKRVYLDKLSYEDVGRDLSIPPGTVKSRMWHCRSKARKALRRVQLFEQLAARARAKSD
jgi:RNA polymerase sigma factor (sigma-70 family)